VHGRRAGVVLRRGALQEWIEGGQKKWFEERVTAVVLGGLRLVSVYQPIWGGDAEEFERYRRDVEGQIAMGTGECLIIGGDFNANVGKGNNREGVCGKYGLGSCNEAGRDLLDWCEENGLVYVNSYMRHRRRGTWFNRFYGRWYELDGFIVRRGERHRLVRRMHVVEERTLSDHKPKRMIVKRKGKRWRGGGGRKERRI